MLKLARANAGTTDNWRKLYMHLNLVTSATQLTFLTTMTFEVCIRCYALFGLVLTSASLHSKDL